MIQDLTLLPDSLLTGIHDVLRYLGAAANYVGFFHTSYAVYLAVMQPDRLQLVTKWLYPDVAKHYDTNWKAVERNIRYTVSSIWWQHPDRLSKLSGLLLPDKPCNSLFLTILSDYCSHILFS